MPFWKGIQDGGNFGRFFILISPARSHFVLRLSLCCLLRPLAALVYLACGLSLFLSLVYCRTVVCAIAWLKRSECKCWCHYVPYYFAVCFEDGVRGDRILVMDCLALRSNVQFNGCVVELAVQFSGSICRSVVFCIQCLISSVAGVQTRRVHIAGIVFLFIECMLSF